MNITFHFELNAFRNESGAWLEAQRAAPFRQLRGLNTHVDLIAGRALGLPCEPRATR